MTEQILETRVCKNCKNQFDITYVDQDFLHRLTPTIAGEQFSLPFPTLCPTCRKTRRFAWRNEKNIYKRKCDATGKDIISLFSPDAPCPVYESDYWYSDRWDAKQYGREYDFSRSFFEHWYELKKIVPMPGKAISWIMENAEYSDNISNLKNCYLVFNAWECEDCLYSVDLWECSDCMDCLNGSHFENCYEVLNGNYCYNVYHSFDVKECHNSFFLFDCEGCQDCYGCYNQKNKKYSLFNIEYSEELYRAKIFELWQQSLDEQKTLVKQFLRENNYTLKLPENIGSEGILESYQVHNSKNVAHASDIRNSEDIRHSHSLLDTRLALDCDIWWDRTENIYECHQVGEALSSVYFSLACWANIRNLFYSTYCVNNVHDCFGCIGLRNASYCILNKQYTKEEYEELVPRIIEKMMNDGEWWEFFPARYSHFGYNQTMNMIKFPLLKNEALKKWFHWSDYDAPFPKVEKIIPANKLPEKIEDIPDDILNWAVECEVSKKPFRIMKQELDFYRKHSLSIPKRHPDERYKERTKIYLNY